MKTTTTSQRLLEIMDEQNLKQVDILERAAPFCKEYDIKLTKTDLSQYVAGKVEPGQAKLFILSNALNVNEAWLMGFDVPKERGRILVKDHRNFNNAILSAISILAEESGFTFEVFCNQYQIRTDELIVKLSANEVDDYATNVLKQVRFVTQSIVTNKLKDNITSINTDLPLTSVPLLNAAHTRTDIKVNSNTDISEDFIMDDEEF